MIQGSLSNRHLNQIDQASKSADRFQEEREQKTVINQSNHSSVKNSEVINSSHVVNTPELV